MIIYNVTLKVDKEIVAEWLQWMKEVHMPELMKTGLFSENKLCRLLEQDETDGATFVAQYFCKSMTEYNKYISEHSQVMREKGMQLFGGKFAAFRTVMEVV